MTCLNKSSTTYHGWDLACTLQYRCSLEAYSSQIKHSFDNVLLALRNNESGDVLLRAALELFYYWSNFGALTRGTSAVGYVSISAVLLAGGFEVSKNLPQGMQLDWEAFFAPNPRVFSDTVSKYLTLSQVT